jgi:beta-galactosidase GanA
MAHLKEKDSTQQTVLMIQVENEVGFLGSERDRSEEANRTFAMAVPAQLRQKLTERRGHLSPELAAQFYPEGKTWHEVFGDAANEVFMAWRYATFVDAVVEAGKKQYELPMYMNAQLPAYMERAGDYPSGGPHPYFLDVYRATAQYIDFYSPDIYWPEFAYWVNRYRAAGLPVFVPEAKLEVAPYNALYAYGAAQAFGFCPFGIDSVKTEDPLIAQVYEALAGLGSSLAEAQHTNRTRGIALYANSARSTQTVALGGYLFQASLSRVWNTGALESQNGAMLLMANAPDEFLVIGTGLTVKISRDPDTDAKAAGIASIEEVTRSGSDWKIVAQLNGDQTNQGRQLTLDSQQVRIYRVRLYAAEW